MTPADLDRLRELERNATPGLELSKCIECLEGAANHTWLQYFTPGLIHSIRIVCEAAKAASSLREIERAAREWHRAEWEGNEGDQHAARSALVAALEKKGGGAE